MNAMEELESVLTKKEIDFLLNEAIHNDYKNMIFTPICTNVCI